MKQFKYIFLVYVIILSIITVLRLIYIYSKMIYQYGNVEVYMNTNTDFNGYFLWNFLCVICSTDIIAFFVFMVTIYLLL